MKPFWTFMQWVLGVVGALLGLALTVPPADAVDNMSGWLRIIGQRDAARSVQGLKESIDAGRPAGIGLQELGLHLNYLHAGATQYHLLVGGAFAVVVIAFIAIGWVSRPARAGS